MDLETLIVAVFCLVDDFVRELCHDRRLRQRGPTPVLADSEVLTVEIVGEFLGLDTDRGLHAYFRRHYGHLFPRLREVHRTTFARQAANLWVVKHALWRRLAAMAGHDPAVALIDSMPVPVCRFARAHRCRSLRGLSAFGHDPVAHQTYYGLRLHLRIAWPGVVTAAALAPANEADLAVAPQLLAGLAGWALGDKGYWSPVTRAELAAGGLDLIAPPRRKSAGARRWPVRLGPTPRPGQARPDRAAPQEERRGEAVAGAAGPDAAPDRDRAGPVRRALPRQAGPGAGRVAPRRPLAAQARQPHPGRPALPAGRPPTTRLRAAARWLNPHIGLPTTCRPWPRVAYPRPCATPTSRRPRRTRCTCPRTS